MRDKNYKNHLAYIIGVALGDGNLSNPNGRAVRLRISCDTKYPGLIDRILRSIAVIMPNNKLSTVKRRSNCVDISCYSNKWEDLLGWKAKKGSKFIQNVSVPSWIKANKEFSLACIRGLIETDGCIYVDRGYKMVNFVTTIPSLARDFIQMSVKAGYVFRVSKVSLMNPHKDRYNIRLSKNVAEFIQEFSISKI